MGKSGANILREFLVAIGFDVDEQAFKNFQTKEASIIKQFETMTKVAAVAGTAVAGAVLKIASDMEELYFSSERAGTSVNALMALRFGGAQAGIGADAMAASIEQMASTIRANPGMVAFFHQLGLPVFADNAKNFANLIGKLRDMDARGGGVMARMIGQQFGFDEQTLTLLFKNYPDFIRGLREQSELLKISGVNAQKFGEDSHAAMEDWRTLLLHLEALGQLFAEHVLPTVDTFVVFLTKSLDLLFELDKATHGWSTTIGGIAIALGGVAATLGVIGSVLGIGGGAVAGVVAAVASPEVAAGALGVAGLIAGYEGLKRLPYKDIAGRATIGYGLRRRRRAHVPHGCGLHRQTKGKFPRQQKLRPDGGRGTHRKAGEKDARGREMNEIEMKPCEANPDHKWCPRGCTTSGRKSPDSRSPSVFSLWRC